MKFLSLLVFSSLFSLAQAKYMPPAIKSTFKDFTSFNQRIANIFSDRITEEPNQRLYYYSFVDVKTYLCIEGKIITNVNELNTFVRELYTHHPFNTLQFEAVAGNLYRMYSNNACEKNENNYLYDYLKQNNLYVSTEMAVVGVGSTQVSNPYQLLGLTKIEEKKLENFGLNINIVETENVWKGNYVYKFKDNFLEIRKDGKLLQTLTAPTIFDYNIPHVSHTGVDEDIKSIQVFKHLRKLALVVYNTENVVSIWTADIDRLNDWTLVGITEPALLLDAKLDEARNGYANDFLAMLSMPTFQLGTDRDGNVYIISTGVEGVYRSGAWKVHRIENF